MRVKGFMGEGARVCGCGFIIWWVRVEDFWVKVQE